MLNVEEMSIITLFNMSSRDSAAKGVRYALKVTKDEELKEALKQLEKKLQQMSDAEFEAIDFTAYEEDEAYVE